MSLATRCPACGTTFKVVRDQLRISDGWVRCGRCSEVFDGTENLWDTTTVPSVESSPSVPSNPSEPQVEPEAAPATEPAPDPTPEPAPEPAPDVEPQPPQATSFSATSWLRQLPSLALGERISPPAAAVFERLEHGDTQQRPADPVEDARADNAVGAGVDGSVPMPGEPTQELEPVLEPERDADRPVLPIAVAGSAPFSAPAESSTPIDPVAPLTPTAYASDVWQVSPSSSLSGDAQSRRIPRRRVAVLVLLSLLLIFQVLYQQRDAIAARQPSLQPALSAMCRVAGCEVSAVRRLGDIVIEGSSFAREKDGEGYLLTFTLRNRAAMALAMPAIELSLLDSQERVVVRRVLTSVDLGAPPVLVAHAEHSTSLPLLLSGRDAESLPRVAGYGIAAFYP